MCVLTRPVKCSRSFAVRSKTSRDKSQNVSKRKSAHSMCARYFLSGRQCNGNLHFPHAIYTTWINFFSTIQLMPTDNLPVSLAIMFMTFGKKTKVAAMQHVFQNLHRRLASVSKHNADMATSAVEWIRSCNMSCPKMFGNISDLLALV